MIRSSIILTAIVASVVLFYEIGWGGTLDSRFSDLMLRLRGVRETSAPVVYMRIDQQAIDSLGSLPFSDESAKRLFSTLRKHNPKKVVLAANAPLLLKSPEKFTFDWLLIPHWGSSPDNPHPMQFTLPDSDGVVRRLYSWHPNRREQGYAWQYDLLGFAPSQASIRIDFVGPVHSIANISAADVLEDAAPTGFLEGRYVVVGIDLPALTRWITTPVSTLDRPMAEGEFHAHALIALLEGRTIERLPLWTNALLIGLTLLLLWLLLLRTTIRTNLILTFIALLGIFGLAATTYLLSMHLLPIAGMSMVAILAFVASSERKARHIHRRTQSIANTSSWELTLRPMLSNTTRVDVNTIWERLSAFATLNLHPSGMLLARPNASGGRIEFTHTYAMGEEDLKEKRRDLARSPYDRVVSSLEAQEVKGFVKDESTTCFIVPMAYPAEITAIWVVCFDSSSQMPSGLKRLLGMIARQTARLLYHSEVRREKRKLFAAFRIDQIEQTLNDIDRIFAQVVEEKTIFQSILDGIDEGIAFFDMYGRLLHMNLSMKTIVEGFNGGQNDITTISELMKKLHLAGTGHMKALTLEQRNDSLESTYYVRGFRFVERVIYRSRGTEEQLPEGIMVIAMPEEQSTTTQPTEQSS